jgi:hypothetical protein
MGEHDSAIATASAPYERRGIPRAADLDDVPIDGARGDADQ